MRKLYLHAIGVLFLISQVGCVSAPATDETGYKKSAKPDLIQGSKLNTELGVGYMRRGDYKIAKQKLEKAIEQNPDNLQAYTTIALLMSRLNEKEKADEYYQEALDLAPDNASLHNSYGAFLCGAGRLDEAMAEFKAAYEDPFYETAYLARSNAGSCLVRNGRYEEAEDLLRTALRTDAELSGALISMAELGVKTKKYLMSRAYIQRYHAGNKPTAESLWIQIQAEKALGAKKEYVKYSNQLLKQFPDSTEAGLLEELRHRGSIN